MFRSSSVPSLPSIPFYFILFSLVLFICFYFFYVSSYILLPVGNSAIYFECFFPSLCLSDQPHHIAERSQKEEQMKEFLCRSNHASDPLSIQLAANKNVIRIPPACRTVERVIERKWQEFYALIDLPRPVSTCLPSSNNKYCLITLNWIRRKIQASFVAHEWMWRTLSQ